MKAVCGKGSDPSGKGGGVGIINVPGIFYRKFSLMLLFPVSERTAWCFRRGGGCEATGVAARGIGGEEGGASLLPPP